MTERSQRLQTTSDAAPAPAKAGRGKAGKARRLDSARKIRRAKDEGTLRRCIVTGESLSPARLIRFVIGPDKALVPDLARELPGRGVWVTANRHRIDEAVARKAFGRAFARVGGPSDPVVPAALSDLLADLLSRRAVHWLGLARRAGQVVAGFEKVREAITAGEVRILVQAADGGDDGRRKLLRLNPGLHVIETLGSAELSLALGRENVVHAALQPGRLATRFSDEANRLAGFRAATEDAPTGAARVCATDGNAAERDVTQFVDGDVDTTENDAACVDARTDARAAPHTGQGRTDE